MALFRSIGAALEDDNTGTNPIDVRKDLGGLFIRAGILAGSTSPLVAGTAAWSYSLGGGSWVTQTATGDGYHLWGSDTWLTVGTSGVGGTVPAAPGAGLSRIDIIWIRHPSNNENGDTTSAPAAGVTCGTNASYPNAPAPPAGAFELARNTMTSAATTTASTGNTITQTAPFTAPRGGVVQCRTTTERDALTALATAANPITVDLLGVLYRCNNGANWRPTPFVERVVTATCAANGTFSGTFPAGTFTVAPVLQCTVQTNTQIAIASAAATSVTAFSGYCAFFSSGALAQAAGFTIAVRAVQMTATTAVS